MGLNYKDTVDCTAKKSDLDSLIESVVSMMKECLDECLDD